MRECFDGSEVLRIAEMGTFVRKDFVFDGDASVRDDVVDGVGGCHRGCCAEELDLVVPVGDIAVYEFHSGAAVR